MPAEPRAEVTAPPPRADLDEAPPLLGTWPRVYALVLVSQALLVVVFYAVTRWYA
ncbi:MAG: hypothetical protein H6744_08365 [Deltaproteobacteria bacterium]|nr:hypothetical protein [Deltaproteobacteria bacterium]MCB9786690.1 hypothetical protein [Deltaproteobacteria bacterium]